MVENVFSRVIFTGYLIASFIIALIYPNLFSRRRTLKSHPLMYIIINLTLLVDMSAVIVFIVKPDFLAFEIPAISVVYSLLAVSLGYYFTVIRPIPNDDVMQYSDELLLLVNDRNNIIYANEKARSVFQRDGKKLISRPASEVIPEITVSDSGPSGSRNQEITISGTLYKVRIKVDTSKQPGIKIIFLTDLSNAVQIRNKMEKIETELGTAIQERADELEKTNTVLRKEIENHKLSEQKLQASLEEKNLLLNEVHHRVKNNLQIMVSLLALQKKYIHDDHTLDIYETAIHRIRSMAMIHERLYDSDRLSNADLSDYLSDLMRHLIHSYKNRQDAINYTINVKDIYLDIDSSVSCGLIINELVVNILKHAFPDDQKDCEILINFSSAEEDTEADFGTGYSYKLEIRDNGKGIPDDFELGNSDSYGFKIVKTLVTQLKGKINVSNENGTVINIEF